MINMTNIARVLLSTGLPQATSKFIADNDEELTYPILRTSMKLQWIIGGASPVSTSRAIPLWQTCSTTRRSRRTSGRRRR